MANTIARPPKSSQWLDARPLLLGFMALALIAASMNERRPSFAWNPTPSVDIGLYGITHRAPRRYEIAAIRLAPDSAHLAHRRGYLPKAALLLKPVAAAAGDCVCRIGPRIVINGVWRARVSMEDAARRPMPRWHGCARLAEGEIFVLGAHPTSFDSRYFGAVGAGSVVGTAVPLLLR